MICLVEDAYLQIQYIVKISRDSDKKKEGATESNSLFEMGLRQKRRQRIEQRIALVWLTFISQTSPKSTSQ